MILDSDLPHIILLFNSINCTLDLLPLLILQIYKQICKQTICFSPILVGAEAIMGYSMINGLALCAYCG